MKPVPTVLGVGALLLASGNASAHTVIFDPPPIIPKDDAKSGPCGCYFGAGPETPGDDATPIKCPASFPKTELLAGQSYDVEWVETVQHTGKFRIALAPIAPQDAKKADLDANVLYDQADTNSNSGAHVTGTITVPNTPCDSCTLQVRQFMQSSASYYYSCAHVAILGGGGAGGAGPSASSSATGTGGSVSVGPGAGGDEPTGPTTGAGGQGATIGAGPASPPPTEEDSSCSVERPGASDTGFRAAIAVLAAAGLGRLRRRRR